MAGEGLALTYDDGWVAMDVLARTASVDGVPTELAPTEFATLQALVSNAGAVVAPADLAEMVWCAPGGASVFQVRLSIARVRAALGPAPQGGSPIVTLLGYGYRYNPPPLDG